MCRMNRRRNNPQDMTLEELVTKARESVCDDICKYLEKANHGEISRYELKQICENQCPMRHI